MIRFRRLFVWDKRTRHFRAPAYLYRQIIKEFIRTKTAYEDEAKKYTHSISNRNFTSNRDRIKPNQSKRGAQNERCGVIVLPTGAGKTHVGDDGDRDVRAANARRRADARFDESVV
jgi:hypothetical protein